MGNDVLNLRIGHKKTFIRKRLTIFCNCLYAGQLTDYGNLNIIIADYFVLQLG